MTPSTWIPILRRKGVPVLFYSYINQGYQDSYYQELLGLGSGLGAHQYVDGWVVVHAGDSDRFLKQFNPRLEDVAFVSLYISQCRLQAETLMSVGSDIRSIDYETADRAVLLHDFMRFSSHTVRVMPFLNSMVFVQQALEQRLSARLAKHYDLSPESEELGTVLQDLMMGGPERPLASRALAELGALAKEIQEKPEVLASVQSAARSSGAEVDLPDGWTPRLEQYLGRYDFLGTDYYRGEPTSVIELCDQLSAYIQAGGLRETAGEDKALAARDAANAGSLAADDRAVIEAAQTLQFLREYRLEALFKAGRDCRNLLSACASVLGVSYEELLCLTYLEVALSLSTGSLDVSLETISARMDGYATVANNATAELYVGESAQKLLRELPVPEEEADVLSGVTAFPGEVVGDARVVDELAKLSNVRAGDVLIAPMTLPYHVPAMARSAAVLTDEGGILSHAAIVARELEIPCVVGLGTATSAFKDGDRLAVAASAVGGTVTRVAGN